ncbi:hypothetical protein [Pelosinus sp. sgz500959]
MQEGGVIMKKFEQIPIRKLRFFLGRKWQVLGMVTLLGGRTYAVVGK